MINDDFSVVNTPQKKSHLFDNKPQSPRPK